MSAVSTEQSTKHNGLDIRPTEQSIDLLGGTIESVLKTTSTKDDFLELAKSETQLTRFSRTFATFIAVDIKFERGAKAIGVFCANLLKQEEHNAEDTTIYLAGVNHGKYPIWPAHKLIHEWMEGRWQKGLEADVLRPIGGV
jgi:hypothetical protein